MLEKLCLTTFEAAEVANVSRSFIYKSIAEGRGPRYRKAGTRTLILKSDLIKWLESLPDARQDALQADG